MAEGPAEQTARAKALIAERKYDEAIRVCRRVLLTRPDLVEVRLLLGEALLATSRYEQVRVEMMALARKHPNVAALHRILGEAYLRAGQQEKARDALRRAVELEPHDEFARALLAESSDEEIAPVSATIERWFGDEEPRTVEQDLPPHFEESTPVPGPLPSVPTRVVAEEPSVQIDPSLAMEAARFASPAQMPTAVGPRAVRPRKPTITGVPVVPPPAASPRNQPALFDDEDETTTGMPARRRAAEPPTDELELQSEPSIDREPEDDEDDPTLMGRRGALAYAPPPRAAQPPHAAQVGVTVPRPVAAPPRPSAPPPRSPALGGLSVGAPAAGSPSPAAGLAGAGLAGAGLAGAGLAAASLAGAGLAAPPRAAPPRSVPPPGMAPAAMPPSFPLAPSSPGAVASPRASHAPPRSGPPPVMQAAPPTLPMPASGAVPAPSVAPAAGATTVAPFAAPPARPRLGGAAPAAAAAGGALELTDPRRPDPGPRPEPITDARRRGGAMPSLRALAIVGAIGLVVVIAGALGMRALLRGQGDDAIREAAHVAGGDGRRTSLARALGVIDAEGADEPWRVALKARLLATLMLEHSEDHAAEVEAALASLAPADAALADARVARSLLLVSQGRGGDALGVLAGLAASGDELAEAFRARAWAAATSGRIPEAEESARQALSARPRTARHASLEAVLRFQAGDPAGALSVLDSVPSPTTSPDLRVARARVLLESGSDPAAAGAEADAVIGELAPSASPLELGWAHLVRARLAASRGDVTTARAEATEAASRAPRWDESYLLAVAETQLAAGDPAGAREVLARLPEASNDPARRASTAAEVALAAGDLGAAEQALVAAGSTAHADLLRGRVREARGELEVARQLYERAAAEPREALAARIRAGAVLLRLNRPRDARAQLEQALRLAPADGEAVTMFVRAALAAGDANAANTVLTAALAQRPDAIDLVSARGSVLLALGRADEAIAALEQACQARPQDAELRAELGDAALRAGRKEAAAAAYAEALRLAPTLARAHLGTARLAIDDARWDDAQGAIERAAGAPPVDVARLQARLAAARGLGASAVRTVEQLLRAHPRDATLLAMLGQLHVQAEDDRDARDAFTRALRADDDQHEALLGRAGIEIRRGDLSGAARSIDAAERAGQQRGAPASFVARVTAARARLQFEASRFPDARRLAEQAIATDPKCAEAHLLLAILAEEGAGDPVAPLRSAIAGTFVPAEAVGLLVPRASGAEACELARRYVAAAPRGYDRSDVDRATRRCD